MVNCPLCQHENPGEALVCIHCGRFRFRDDAPPASGLTLPVTRMREDRLGAPASAAPGMSTLHELPDLPALPAVTAKLLVIRGLKTGAEYTLYEGANYLGRTAEQPADIDLTVHEQPEQVWASRQHSAVHLNGELLSIEDLNSLNGTFVNRTRLHAGRKYNLKDGDVIQIGTVQFKVVTS